MRFQLRHESLYGYDVPVILGEHVLRLTPRACAWAEVLLPGVGWRGWDATHGLRVSDGHVALCAAPGAVVNSTLDHSVRIRTS